MWEDVVVAVAILRTGSSWGTVGFAIVVMFEGPAKARRIEVFVLVLRVHSVFSFVATARIV